MSHCLPLVKRPLSKRFLNPKPRIGKSWANQTTSESIMGVLFMMPGFDLIHWSSHLMTRSIGSSAILLDCIYHIQRQRTANFEIFTHPLRSNWFKCCPFNWPHIVDDLILYCKWSDIIGLPGCNASIIQENMHHTEFANTTLPLPALLHHWTKKQCISQGLRSSVSNR